MIKKVLLGILGLIFTANLFAQETIMNQPSADIVDRGHLFVRSDSFYTQNPAYFEQIINLAYGLGHNFEVGINGGNLAHNNTLWQVIPNFKWSPVKHKNFEFYIGDQYWKPVSNFTYYHNGNVSYEAFALKIENWRFTAGSYQSVNSYRPGLTSGALAGVEYMTRPLYKSWMLAPGVDWASGAGSNGYVSPGLSFAKGNFFVCPGYMIGNPHAIQGAHQSFVMVGYIF